MSLLRSLLPGISNDKSRSEYLKTCECLKECDVRRHVHMPGNTTREYDADKSGTILYQFNSRGYRGEEYDPSARFRICVIGESCAFGSGIRFEDTFGYKLKQHMAAALQFGVAQVNLINLSAGGASADYCVRTLYRQLSTCDVDLLVCHLPSPDRTEYTNGRTFSTCGIHANPQVIKDAPPHLLGYFEYYNLHMGRINLIKNALLAQTFLKERQIDYVLATQDLGMKSLGYVKDYFDRLDTGAVLLHQYFSCKVDRAADNGHPGPRTHAAFAIELLSFFGRMHQERGNKNLGRRIETYASHLRDTDEDWRYCAELISKRAKDAPRLNAR